MFVATVTLLFFAVKQTLQYETCTVTISALKRSTVRQLL